MRAQVQLPFLASAVGLCVGVAACYSPAGDPDSTVPRSCTSGATSVAAIKTDILFVVDNSGSMAEEQAGVASELPAFIDELQRGGGAGHDFRVGMITTSVYQHGINSSGVTTYYEFPNESGRLQPVPVPLADGGTEPGPERYLDSTDPQLIERFTRLVRAGTIGSGQETPFEAVRLAVTGALAETPIAQGGNGGFLRDGARLFVVVVSDEDDCSEQVRPPVTVVGRDQSRDYCAENAASLVPVSQYADLFQNLVDGTGNARPVMWAAIAPVSQSTKEAAGVVDSTGVLRNVDCPTSFQPGVRQREMALSFDQSLANLESICKGSWRETLLGIAQIANSARTLDVTEAVPDPRLLIAEVTRADGTRVTCSAAKGEIEYHVGENRPDYVEFTAACPRKPDDRAVQLQLICAG